MKIWYLLVISVLLFGCCNNEKVVFVPTYYIDGQYVYGSDSLTTNFQHNIKCVFYLYDIKYNEVGHKIYIKPMAKELLRNYTSKAEDINWLRKKGCI